MNFIIRLSILYCIGSTLGWLIELIFRRFFSSGNPEKRWINPGFLCGPYIPLYGFGLCILYLLAGLESKMNPGGPSGKIGIFVIMALSLTAAEYLAGLIFIKGMKVNLWDYSDMPCNLQGIICLQFSLYWALLGIIYYLVLHRPLTFLLDSLSHNIATTSLIGAYIGIFAIDFIYSCNILSKIRSFAVEHKIIVKYDRLRSIVAEKMAEKEKRPYFFVSLRSDAPISEHLISYLKWMEGQIGAANSALSERKNNGRLS